MEFLNLALIFFIGYLVLKKPEKNEKKVQKLLYVSIGLVVFTWLAVTLPRILPAGTY